MAYAMPFSPQPVSFACDSSIGYVSIEAMLMCLADGLFVVQRALRFITMRANYIGL
jgi:hypothetical protein